MTAGTSVNARRSETFRMIGTCRLDVSCVKKR